MGGLSIQLSAMVAFVLVHISYRIATGDEQEQTDQKRSTVHGTPQFQRFLRGTSGLLMRTFTSSIDTHVSLALSVITLLLLTYNIYRIIEFAPVVSDTLSRSEISFFTVDALFPFLSALLLIIFLPSAALIVARDCTSMLSQRQYSYGQPESTISPPLALNQRYQCHYDPSITKSFTETAGRAHISPKVFRVGSPGLPPNPRPSSWATPPWTGRNLNPSTGSNERAGRCVEPEGLVDKDALW